MLQLYLLFVWGEDKCINIHRFKLQYQLKPISIKKKKLPNNLKEYIQLWFWNVSWKFNLM